ncbi:NADP-dependent oxidoreductase domain-containing protein [Phakopsora pachyrhizi]|nr:NADP-dependent oxidoreductase domain-containing protein [Phakopsora pachyrhizi]
MSSCNLDSIKPPKPNYWDLILLHDPTSGPNNRIEAYRALAEGLKRGHSKSIGVSNFGVTHLVELEEAKVGPIPAIKSVQAYCPLVRGQFMDHPTLVEIAKRHGFVPLPKSDSPNRIKENVEVFDFELDSQSMEQLDGLDKGDSGAISWNPTSVA